MSQPDCRSCVWLLFGVLLLIAAGCSGGGSPSPGEQGTNETARPVLSPVPLGAGERVKAIATTSMVYDVVSNVGGDLIELTRLMPLGADPHAFEPTPREVAAIADAQVVFANGAGLEVFLQPLLESAGSLDKVVELSRGVGLLGAGGVDEEHGSGDEPGEFDPHTWTDPNNVVMWASNVEQALSALDPAHQESYRARATAYRAELEALDGWIREEVALVPEGQRELVTDHLTFGYLAHRYGFRQVGAAVPGYSTLAQPSAKDLAELETAIRELGVKAVFVGRTVNPNLAESVARDTGVRLVYLYTGSLTDPSGDAPTYLEYMRANVRAIVEALRPRG